MPRPSKVRPRRVNQATILSYLREPIVRGALRPGDRLPAQADVVAKFGSSPLTVKRAFRQLVTQGFARAVPKIGTFVADRLPHLSRYALVFSGNPDEDAPWLWSRYHSAIIEAARAESARSTLSFPTFLGVNDRPDSEGYQALIREIDNQRLAGICFASPPHETCLQDLIERAHPPTVHSTGQYPGIVRSIDGRQFIYRALDALFADGRRRFAVMTLPQSSHGLVDEIETAVASRGGVTYPFWTQAVVPHHTEWVRHAVDAILSTHAAQLPDALMITDDHLVEPVAEALAEFGVRVPEDIRVVGHWNFPLAYRGSVPIDLLGFDAGELLRSWVDAIDAQRRGEAIPRVLSIPARFALELPDTCPASTNKKPKSVSR